MARVEEIEDDDELTRRMVFLTDGVVAIAMTLLALDLRPDLSGHVTSATLAHYLRLHYAGYVAFAVAFYVVANYWLLHHRALRGAHLRDRTSVLLSLAFLFFITLVPLTTYVQGAYATALGRSIFAGNLALVGTCLGLLSAKLHGGRALRGRAPTPEALRSRVRTAYTVLVMALVAGLSWVAGVGSEYAFLLAVLNDRVADAAVRLRGLDPGRHERRSAQADQSMSSSA